MKKTIIFTTATLIVVSCNQPKNTNFGEKEENKTSLEQTPTNEMKEILLSGKISIPEMTTYQYGTHVLTGKPFDKDNLNTGETKNYALRSLKYKLDDFVGKNVVITGVKVEGYPIEGGPELIEVININMTQEDASSINNL